MSTKVLSLGGYHLTNTMWAGGECGSVAKLEKYLLCKHMAGVSTWKPKILDVPAPAGNNIMEFGGGEMKIHVHRFKSSQCLRWALGLNYSDAFTKYIDRLPGSENQGFLLLP